MSNLVIDENKVGSMIIDMNIFKDISIDTYEKYFKNCDDYSMKYVPMIVNAVFSTEIGLKYIQNFENDSYAKGHLLYEHWKKLSDNSKKCIVNYMRTIFNEAYDIKIVSDKISDASNLFQELRYFYEKSNHCVEPKFILEFMSAVAYLANYLYKHRDRGIPFLYVECLEEIKGEEKYSFDY
jgi:hypothetical protein